MKTAATGTILFLALAATAAGAEDLLDQLSDNLSVSSPGGAVSARLSGTVDLEDYFVQNPSPGLIYTDQHSLLVPRAAFFLDAQLGESLYFFTQTRVDQGFDPHEDGRWQVRIDEYVLRYTPPHNKRFSLQIGKFATVVGNWVPRHGSWENPFITAPLPYENLTGVWDAVAARSSGILFAWSHVVPNSQHITEYDDKHERSPLIWGPSYASGFAVMGEIGRLTYAAEIKNASLSAKPESWNDDGTVWNHPTLSARVGYRPNMMWNLGLSASTGSYLRPSAAPTMLAGYGLGDYRQIVVGQDASFAWHYWQIWMEAFEGRFEIPRVGNADTFSYYAEVKYKFTPQFFGAVRWNQQTFGTLLDRSGNAVKWDRDIWRLDAAPTYRFTPHLQGKLQYSLIHQQGAVRDYSHMVSAQITVRF